MKEHIGGFRGKPNRVCAHEGQIARKWFTLVLNFTNTPSPPKGIPPLTTAIPKTGNGLGLISLFSSYFYLNQTMSSMSLLNSNIYVQKNKKTENKEREKKKGTCYSNGANWNPVCSYLNLL